MINTVKKKQFTLEIINSQSDLTVSSPKVKKTCQKILDDHSVETGFLTIVFVDSMTMHQKNVEFLQHDYPTDVISFPLEALSDGHLEGEILVCPRVAIKNAEKYGLTPEEETLLYAVHGTLHLVGYDDKTPAAKRTMRKMEKKYLGNSDTACCGSKRVVE
jgi:probable rRNA maturation factor